MKILVIRFSSIGDIVLTTPIVRCLKQQIKDSEIHFLTKEKFADLLAPNPNIDHIHSIENSITSSVLHTLKEEKYALVIDLHKNIRTRKLRSALGVKWLSYKKLNIQKWLFVNFKVNLLPTKHIIDRYFDGIKSLQVVNDSKGIDFYLAENTSSSTVLKELPQEDYIAIAIGGTYYTKQIPIDITLSIIKRLNNSIVLLGGGSADYKKAVKIMQKIDTNNVLNLCDKLSIMESAAVIKKAKHFITSDTGLMHIATAFETPISTLWGNTHASFGMYAYRPATQNIFDHRVPQKCNPCSKLGSDTCPRGHFNCMELQNVEQIVKNC